MSAMPPETGYSDDTRILEALDFELDCEALHGCDKHAEWKLMRKCCTTIDLLCDIHRKYQDEWMKSVVDRGRSFSCVVCETRHITLEDVWWEKL